MSFVHSRARKAPFCFALAALWAFAFATCVWGQNLEIHYINVGQGGSTLIIGPDGTTILYDLATSSATSGSCPTCASCRV